MKKQAYAIAIMIMLMTGVGISTAQAQSIGGNQLIATVPFAFNVGNKTLPAGEYAVKWANPASDLKVLQLRSTDGITNVMVSTNSVIGKMQENAKLIFNRYGDRYFFAQAWLPADAVGLQAPRSKHERAVAKEVAAIERKTETVALKAQR
jgi:hypothetical protein